MRLSACKPHSPACRSHNSPPPLHPHPTPPPGPDRPGPTSPDFIAAIDVNDPPTSPDFGRVVSTADVPSPIFGNEPHHVGVAGDVLAVGGLFSYKTGGVWGPERRRPAPTCTFSTSPRPTRPRPSESARGASHCLQIR
jgi:hypothetical protein